MLKEQFLVEFRNFYMNNKELEKYEQSFLQNTEWVLRSFLNSQSTMVLEDACKVS